MSSRPFARPFSRLHARPPVAVAAISSRGTTAVARAAVALTLLLPAACSSTESATPAAPAAARAAPTRLAARDLSWTTTFEIRFGGELVGYLVEVNPVPEGIVDSRLWEPGTALIQDTEFEFVGYISPRGTVSRFDEDDVAQAVGFGGRDANIAAFFHRDGKPQIVAPYIGG